MRLAFWQQLASPHQAPFIRELAERLGPGGVTCVFERPLDQSLRRLGWQQDDLDYGQAQIVYSGGDGQAVAAGLPDAAHSIHIFSSLAPYPGIRAAYRELVKQGRTIGLLSEARDWRGWRGALRRVESLRHERAWRRDVSFVLAIGSMGRRWYELCGYENSRVFDFCYVVETPGDVEVLADVSDDFRVVFVGRLVSGKRVDLLLRAIAKLRHSGLSLDIIGDGPLEEDLRRLVQELQIQDAVRFRGGMPNTHVNRELSIADLLVLPSHWDGWGAVINEALCNGARVVCSDFCGATDLVSDPQIGRLFREGSLESLTQAMDAMINMGKVSSDERARIRAYSSTFAGPAVAKYLLRVVAWVTDGAGERPAAPWRHFTGGADLK